MLLACSLASRLGAIRFAVVAHLIPQNIQAALPSLLPAALLLFQYLLIIIAYLIVVSEMDSVTKPPSESFDTILVLDFGSQYSQLITRRLRDSNVCSA